MYRRIILGCLLLAMLVGCGAYASPSPDTPQGEHEAGETVALADANAASAKLRLATTTSTADSGLLDAILPDFERRYHADVDVVAVGTGQALKLGENGDADVVLVHAREREDAFVGEGFGINRRDVMYNDFVIVGPAADPAQIRGVERARDALRMIAAAEAPFASRGDDSGTHAKEQTLWTTAGLAPSAEHAWYKPLGQGMGETLLAAYEQQAYTLTDRGTFLAMRDSLADLEILVGGATVVDNPDPTLRNPYGVIQVNPARHHGINADLAETFIEWITSAEVQQRIGSFGVEAYGQPLFYPQESR